MAKPTIIVVKTDWGELTCKIPGWFIRKVNPPVDRGRRGRRRGKRHGGHG